MSCNVDLDYQIALSSDEQRQSFLPVAPLLTKWIDTTLQLLNVNCQGGRPQITLRVVGKPEMIQLNSRFRGKQNVTNVLSFPFESPEGVNVPLLGDIIVCAAVVSEEAKQQLKQDEQHWAHMVVHGVLHLLGYDHLEQSEARHMESLEIEVLSKLGFPNPYGEISTL